MPNRLGAVNFISVFSLAAFRTPASPWDTPFPLCVGYVLGCVRLTRVLPGWGRTRARQL